MKDKRDGSSQEPDGETESALGAAVVGLQPAPSIGTIYVM